VNATRAELVSTAAYAMIWEERAQTGYEVTSDREGTVYVANSSGKRSTEQPNLTLTIQCCALTHSA
jgi:hypothetical protein